MRKLQTVLHYTDEELKELIESQTEICAFRDWQIIYWVQTNPGKNSGTIARMSGVKKSKVLYVIQQYNKKGLQWRLYGQWGGRREERCHLSIEGEASLLKSIESEALLGQVLTYRQIKNKVEEKVGKEVSEDYVCDLFSRHSWKKKVPRQSHPKADKQAQEEYQKTSGQSWQPVRKNSSTGKIQDL